MSKPDLVAMLAAWLITVGLFVIAFQLSRIATVLERVHKAK